MTVKELYDWAKKMNCENYTIVVRDVEQELYITPEPNGLEMYEDELYVTSEEGFKGNVLAIL